MSGEDFRHILKDRTGADHRDVDRALSRFDVVTQQGLRDFLAIHHVCFSQMHLTCRSDGAVSVSLTDMIARIETDLNCLDGVSAETHRPVAGSMLGGAPLDRAIDPLACAYLVEGSRLGSQVLQRRWMSSDDPVVLSADAYFSLVPVKGRWREVCEHLSAVPPAGLRADEILTDTSALFRLFLRAAEDAAACGVTKKEGAA